MKTHYDEINRIYVRADRHREDINKTDTKMKEVLKRLDKLEKKVKEQAEVIRTLDEMVDHHSETITKIPGCCCAKGMSVLAGFYSNNNTRFTEIGMISRFRFRSPEPSVHDSDRDAEGVTDPGTDPLGT